MRVVAEQDNKITTTASQKRLVPTAMLNRSQPAKLSSAVSEPLGHEGKLFKAPQPMKAPTATKVD